MENSSIKLTVQAPLDAQNFASSTREPNDFVLYRAPNAPPPPSAAIPDSFFEPTGADVKAAQTMLATRTQSLTNAPLMTQAMRESAENQKRDRWPRTNIRIRFHDRMQLEKTFSSREGVKSVAAFLRSVLKEDMKAHKFILYQTPPRREFRVSDPAIRGRSLYDLQLAPSSILYVKFLDDPINGLPTHALLAPSVFAQVQDLPPTPEVEASENTPSSGNALRSSPAVGSGSGSTKVPKWLKLGKK